jgi:hypothetical protein
MILKHRLTWRGYCAVHVEAETREAAIAEAIKRKPLFIPPGTQLYYGIAGGMPVYTVPNDEKIMYSSVNPGDEMTAPMRVVLHRGIKDAEWVTHIQNMQTSGFDYGNYHGSDYAAALRDYRARCVKYNVLSYVCDHCGSPEHTNENCPGPNGDGRTDI